MSLLARLSDWMPRQRWYLGKGSSPRLRLLTTIEHAGEDPAARVRTLIVADDSRTPPVVYQVPVVERVGLQLDGAADPAYSAALHRALGGDGSPGDVLAAEQSNTSIVYRGPSPWIGKLYRVLQPGISVEVELQTALSDAGCPHVPRMLGRLTGSWPDPADAGRQVSGTLAVAQEYLTDAVDGWTLATSSDASFAASAHGLGEATARVHAALAERFGTWPADDRARGAIVRGWHERLALAEAAVPALAPQVAQLAQRFERAAGSAWPALQRIHGDLHLGQTLRTPVRGWLLLDFEGEPLRPAAERAAPDLALRDVAGMLRSCDYAGARDAGDAFLRGYATASGLAIPHDDPLLRALQLDKAVYEARYEATFRPSWLPIPLAGIARLLGR